MEKQLVDHMMETYFHKIYGFAVKKAYSDDEAQELCAEMVKEVYLSLLSAEAIANLDGYVWRICSNVFAKHVHSKKKQGISLDGIELPYYDEYQLGEAEEELLRLRREIAYLTKSRRKTVFSFYYEGKSIATIAGEMGLSEGTVKWHLNKARNDLKEGFKMERKIGTLGISPIEAIEYGHNGRPDPDGGPEKYLSDSINLNIAYSVYETPRTKEEIAQELGITPVFLEDKIALLENNGFLVRTSGDRYTTYVCFSPRKYSLEQKDKGREVQLQVVQELLKKYVPKVRAAIADFQNVYIPGGNRELFEAAVIFYAITNKCGLSIQRDLGKYWIKTLGGGAYFAQVQLKQEPEDPDYEMKHKDTGKDYFACGNMTRESEKYEGVYSWSIDTRYCSRKGAWENNRNEDYDFLYEWICGTIKRDVANQEKVKRLRDREYITADGRVNVMIVKEKAEEFFAKIPELDEEIKKEFAGFALEQAMEEAKRYPSQMQDYVVFFHTTGFIGPMEALMVLDEMYDQGIFQPLKKEEMVTSQLLTFCDRLPE